MQPFGEERADLRAGIVSATIANCNRASKDAKAFSPSDFMPEFGKEKKKPDVGQQVKDVFGAIKKRFQGKGGEWTGGSTVYTH